MRSVCRLGTLVIAMSAVSFAQSDPGKLLRSAAEKYRTATAFELHWETKITTTSPYADG